MRRSYGSYKQCDDAKQESGRAGEQKSLKREYEKRGLARKRGIKLAVDVLFAGVGLIILLGFLADLLFSKTNIPDVLWLILIGVLIGPLFHLIEPASLGASATIFTSFALLFILFEGGLHIRIKDLMKKMYGGTLLATANFIITSVVVTLLIRSLGWSWTAALLLGVILGGTSSAVVIPLVRRLQMGNGNALMLILESAFTDVLCIVVTLSIIQVATLKDVHLGGLLNSLFGSFAIAIFVGGLFGVFWIFLLEKFPTLGKSYISTIGILLILFGLTEFAKSSGAIAALTFGIIMGNSRKILSVAEGEQQEQDALSSSARAFFSQISFFVKTFFFVYIGILTSFTDWYAILLGLLLALTCFIIRPLAVQLVYKAKESASKDRPIMEAMVPKGLAAAVLAQVPLQYGIAQAEYIQTPVFATIFFTILFTTVLVFLIKQDKYPGTTSFLFQVFGKWPSLAKTGNTKKSGMGKTGSVLPLRVHDGQKGKQRQRQRQSQRQSQRQPPKKNTRGSAQTRRRNL